MKFPRPLIAVPAILLAAAATAPGAPARQHDSRLSMAEARASTRALARGIARRNQMLNSARVKRCDRLGASRVDCLASLEGNTSLRSTTCAMWVRVRLTDRRPAADRGRIRCRSKRLPLLRNDDALPAFEAAAREAGIEGLRINELERLSRVKILAYAGWAHKLPPPSSETEELCAMQMEGELVAAGNIVIRSGDPKCTIFRG